MSYYSLTNLISLTSHAVNGRRHDGGATSHICDIDKCCIQSYGGADMICTSRSPPSDIGEDITTIKNHVLAHHELPQKLCWILTKVMLTRYVWIISKSISYESCLRPSSLNYVFVYHIFSRKLCVRVYHTYTYNSPYILMNLVEHCGVKTRTHMEQVRGVDLVYIKGSHRKVMLLMLLSLLP